MLDVFINHPQSYFLIKIISQVLLRERDRDRDTERETSLLNCYVLLTKKTSLVSVNLEREEKKKACDHWD